MRMTHYVISLLLLSVAFIGGCIPMSAEEQVELESAKETITTLTDIVTVLESKISDVKDDIKNKDIPIESGMALIEAYKSQQAEAKKAIIDAKDILSNLKGKSFMYIWEIIASMVGAALGFGVQRRQTNNKDTQLAAVISGIDKAERYLTPVTDPSGAGKQTISLIKGNIQNEAAIVNVSKDLHGKVKSIT